MTPNIIVFSDFDGTIAVRDVGNRLFHHFSSGKSEEPVAEWRAGKISSQECLQREAELTRDLTEEEFYAYVDEFDLDPDFGDFVSLIRSNDLPLYILSDGLDLYIRYLLEKNGFGDIPFYSNQARIENDRLSITWPYIAQSCGNCGNCKGYHIGRLKQKDHTVIYIGDGKSDVCAIPESDIIFAKGTLAEYCRDNNIDFFAIENFASVTDITTTRILKEHEPSVRRRDSK